MITIRHYPKKRSIAYGDCPFNQTLCNKIGEDAINGCPLCDPYAKGKKPATYPMPATLDNGETASAWLILSSCPHKDGPCWACLDKWEDQMLYDFPFLDTP